MSTDFFKKLVRNQAFWTAAAMVIATLSGASTLIPAGEPPKTKPTPHICEVSSADVSQLAERVDEIQKTVQEHVE